eukprot:TRINITY_DN5742_c1_g2_i1.p1 TRINITY_DN5742_c1_g2~~TRINITY_DN5742_c1_g2_i1.p1  ORF type:complete len:216 (+),score=52.58 TRINITY_DN5742_c1_g2_i1:47-649(+)
MNDAELDDEGAVTMATIDLEKVRNMPAAEWREERKRRIMDKIIPGGSKRLKSMKMGPHGGMAGGAIPPPPPPPPPPSAGPGVHPAAKKQMFHQKDGLSLTLSGEQLATHRQQEQETKDKLNELNKRLSDFRKKSPIIAELEEYIATSGTLSKARAIEIVESLRQRRPHASARHATGSAVSSKAGKLMIAMTGKNTLDAKK